jgi:carboxyl-terminal processing protease
MQPPRFETGLSVVLAGASLLVMGSQEPAPPANGRWTAKQEMLVFFQAVQAIETHALIPQTADAIVRESLQDYLGTLDPYSHYLNPTEHAALQSGLQGRYAGVGMELCLRPQGGYECVPYPDSPAALAGIRERDILMQVDGADVAGWSLEQLGGRIRGEPGAEVELTVQRGEDSFRFGVTRRAVQAPSVMAARIGPAPLLRVYTFRDTTADELRNAIQALPPEAAVVVDLRGNPGGDPYGAADAANLFLERDTVLLRIRNRNGTTNIVARRPPAFPDRPLILLQDERTASAAEVFVAALAANRRALSIGRPSFGKGTTQRIEPLLDGSAIVLTDGECLPPQGEGYHGQGLNPSLAAEDAGDEACLKILRKLPALQPWFQPAELGAAQ